MCKGVRSEEYKPKYASTTGKKIEKIEVLTGIILETWDTIAKAVISEGISAAKMSRSVKIININKLFSKVVMI